MPLMGGSSEQLYGCDAVSILLFSPRYYVLEMQARKAIMIDD